jgi:hypothetical protein
MVDSLLRYCLNSAMYKKTNRILMVKYNIIANLFLRGHNQLTGFSEFRQLMQWASIFTTNH